MTQDANELLMGGGIKSINWKDNPVGYTAIGTITDTPKVEQMKKYQTDELDFWPSGDPKMQIVVTVQTDLRDPSNAHDDGKRRLHIPPRMMATVREAIQRANAKGLEIGGRLAVRRIGGTGVTGDPFQFAAEYGAPVVDPGSMLATNGNAASAPQQAAPQYAPGFAPQQPFSQPAPTPPAQQTPLQASVLGTPAAAPAAPPAGVDPGVWANLPDGQKQAILAAMAPAGQPGF